MTTSSETTVLLKKNGFPMPIEPDPIILPTQQVVWFEFGVSATDILKELGRKFTLNFTEDGWFCSEWLESGIATIRITGEWSHTNPAEACALAWLAKNEKK